MTITFIGHATIPSDSNIKELVKREVRNLIICAKSVTSYLGGYDDFDKICACACMELKKEHLGIENVYVTPYMSLSAQEKIKRMQNSGCYDAFIYPPLENAPPRFAILKRNEWMIENANLIIAYVNHKHGGAYKSLQIAIRKQKEIINICNLI